MAVPVDFQLKHEVDAAYGLQFLADLAQSMKVDPARLDLDGVQFQDGRTVSDVKIYVKYNDANPQAVGAFLHSLSVEFRQLRDEQAGHLANGQFDDLVGIAISDHCVPERLAAANSLDAPPRPDPASERDQHVRVPASTFAALDLPLSPHEKSLLKQKSPDHNKSSSYPDVTRASEPAASAASVSRETKSSNSSGRAGHVRAVTSFPAAAAAAPQSKGSRDIGNFIKFFEGLGKK